MLYHNVLKMEDKAAEYLKRGLLLGQSLYPVLFYASWYQVSDLRVQYS